ncbi:hypothetical protein ALQ18_03363 [Pseudomonas marginalis pv. marginalis]|nr:hypothetical protein ALQ18_03363 [Pseudomonas marginalis pv. marginalis]
MPCGIHWYFHKDVSMNAEHNSRFTPHVKGIGLCITLSLGLKKFRGFA